MSSDFGAQEVAKDMAAFYAVKSHQ